MTKLSEGPLISILIPCKNAAQYLDECLSSIVKQSYKSWELIIVDDQSTDQSWTILASWSSKYDNIRILKNNGTGIISALRLAYSVSIGRLITRMDADDLMTLAKLEIMASQLILHGPGHLATGKVKYFRNDQALGDGYERYAHWLNSLSENGTNFNEIYKECSIPSPCWMLYREDLDAIQAFQPDIYPEDYDLVFRMYKKGLRIIPSTNEVLHFWRDHGSRASRNDANYKDNRFLDLKTSNFINIDFKKDHKLALWGAGKKAKHISKILISKEIEFYWVTNNDKKIGHNIYGKILCHPDDLVILDKVQTILTMANHEDQKAVEKNLETLTTRIYIESFWFC